ncbi:hypothetical protein PsYK624_046840 [Phanerochaete sordida]|uniref:Uncharacterized protein n=1 Tax=Phanerochaete sordida TaxID=48140 RepID=A0A9P3LAN1_9APHY|nr:hypothetical protein PsYK624_046840 [Phanerochaete sordida]
MRKLDAHKLNSSGRNRSVSMVGVAATDHWRTRAVLRLRRHSAFGNPQRLLPNTTKHRRPQRRRSLRGQLGLTVSDEHPTGPHKVYS